MYSWYPPHTSWYPPNVLMKSPDVLMISPMYRDIPQCTHGIPQCTHGIPQCTHGIPNILDTHTYIYAWWILCHILLTADKILNQIKSKISSQPKMEESMTQETAWFRTYAIRADPPSPPPKCRLGEFQSNIEVSIWLPWQLSYHSSDVCDQYLLS